MASVFNSLEQDEEDKNKEQGQELGGSAIVSGAPSQAPNQGAQRAQQGSGRFTNLQKYINANKNTDYASKIGENLNKQEEDLSSSISGAKQEVENKVNPEITRLNNSNSLIQGVGSNPTDIANDENKLAEFNKLKQGNYIKDIGVNVDAQRQQAQSLQENANLANSETGRYQLLRNAFNNPSYSKGANKLDQLLLQGQSGQLSKLQKDAQQKSQVANENVGNLSNLISDYQNQINTLGTNAATSANDAITQSSKTLNDALTQRKEAEQAQRQEIYNQTVAGLQNNGIINPQTSERLGLDAGVRGYGINRQELLSYLNPNVANQNVEIGNIISPEELAKYNALNKLSGNESANMESLGALANPIDFNKDALVNNLNGRQESMFQDLHGLINSDVTDPSARENYFNLNKNAILQGYADPNSAASNYFKLSPGGSFYNTFNAFRQKYGIGGYDPNTGEIGLDYLTNPSESTPYEGPGSSGDIRKKI